MIDECVVWRVSKSLYSVCTQDSTGSVVLPYRQVLSSPYPSTHIDVDINTVKQMPPCHEHTYHQRRYMRAELSTLWKTTSEDEISPDHLVNIQESFTPDLYVFSHTAYIIRHQFFSHEFLCPLCCLMLSLICIQDYCLKHKKHTDEFVKRVYIYSLFTLLGTPLHLLIREIIHLIT